MYGILVNYLAPEYGSLFLFPIQIRIQSNINADSDLQHCFTVGGAISFYMFCIQYKRIRIARFISVALPSKVKVVELDNLICLSEKTSTVIVNITVDRL